MALWWGFDTAGQAPWVADHGTRLHWHILQHKHTFHTWTRKINADRQQRRNCSFQWKSTNLGIVLDAHHEHWQRPCAELLLLLLSLFQQRKGEDHTRTKSQLIHGTRKRRAYNLAHKGRNAVITCLHWFPPPWIWNRTGSLHINWKPIHSVFPWRRPIICTESQIHIFFLKKNLRVC